jgi:GNAT superfamily N-acetyltransferase
MAELAGELGYPSRPDDIVWRLASLQSSDDHQVFILERVDGGVAGWIGVSMYRSVESDACAEITGLVVDERFRSQGIGQRLLGRAEDWARDKGCSVVRLRSNVTRGRAHAFYERCGHEHFRTPKSYHKTLSVTEDQKAPSSPVV